MNLFVIGWGLPQEHHSVARSELARMIEVYPQLDPGTLWHRSSPCGTMFIASMHTADRVAAPRRYVAQSDDQVVFYSGLPVDPTGDYSAHRAESLSAHWDHLTESLEGQHVVIRAIDDPLRLELITDFLGVEQVYYSRQGDVWLVSNNVRLIEQIGKPSALDPLGVSIFLTFKAIGADRTLRRDVRVIPGGQHWVWQKGDTEPRRQSYFSPSKFARQPRQALSRPRLERLADDLMRLCHSLSQGFEINCPLTGGRDSRLLAALLIGAGIPAQYHTVGNPDSLDVKIGRLIAQTCNLPHQVNVVTVSDVAKKWDDICWQYIRQNDGMSNLWQIADVLEDIGSQIDRLALSLWGVGGEIARGRLSEPRLLGRYGVASIQRSLVAQKIKDFDGLVRPEGTTLVRDYIHRFVTQCVDEGFAPVDVPDVFYAFQRVGRFGGTGVRRAVAVRDVFSPFYSRPFVEAAFALSAQQRYTEPLHYGLIRLLAPELHDLLCDKGPWRLQRPTVNLLYSHGTQMLRGIRRYARRRVPRVLRRSRPKESSQKARVFAHADWLEAKREQVREICLDQSTSLLWNFVDRAMFERIMAPDADPKERFRCREGLYSTATLFYYEADHQR